MKQVLIHLYGDSMSIKLYENLISQLNKDFSLSGISVEVSQSCIPAVLVREVSLILSELLVNNNQKLHQLMYVLDVPEKKLHSLKEVEPDCFINQLTQLILERVFKKVYMKQKLSEC